MKVAEILYDCQFYFIFCGKEMIMGLLIFSIHLFGSAAPTDDSCLRCWRRSNEA